MNDTQHDIELGVAIGLIGGGLLIAAYTMIAIIQRINFF